MMDYLVPTMEQIDEPTTLKDGLSERKPLFDQWGDTRVSQTPRMRRIESHNSKEETDD